MKNDFSGKADEIKRLRQKQLDVLYEEERLAGGYQKWYDSLRGFREYIRKRYIRFDILGKMYRYRTVTTDNGDIIDHHTISYLSPLDFERVGWNNEKLYPHEHVKLLSDFFTKNGKRFIYAPVPNKGNVYPHLICDNDTILIPPPPESRKNKNNCV